MALLGPIIFPGAAANVLGWANLNVQAWLPMADWAHYFSGSCC